MRLTLYSVDGRALRTWREERWGGRRRNIQWDGRDERGLPVASGLYFVHRAAGPVTYSGRLLIQRE